MTGNELVNLDKMSNEEMIDHIVQLVEKKVEN